MSQKPIYETMTEKRLDHWNVRVWCTSPVWKMGPDPTVLGVLYAFRDETNPAVICHALDGVAGVAAYEITDRAGHGGICYREWP